MSLDPTLFDQPPRLYTSALAAATAAEVAEVVPALLDLWLGRTAPDHEILSYAGIAIAKAGHVGADRAALAWLDADPVDLRLELAAWFLFGYFRDAGAVVDGAWRRLFEALDRLDPASMLYMGVVSALASLVRSKALLPTDERARLREALLRHLDRLEGAGALPGLTSQLQWLRRAGPAGRAS